MIDKAVKSLSLATLGLAVALPAAAGTVTSKGADLELDTTGGFKVRTTDDKFSFNIGGRMMWDMDHFSGAFNKSANDRNVTSDNLRRARLEMKGVVYSDWKYKFEYNVNGDSGSINALALGYAGLKGHYFQIGKDKEPFGLEELSSSKWITATERSMFWDTTGADDMHFGLLYSGYNGMFTWAAGAFDNDEDDSTSGDDEFAFTARATAAPMAEKGNVLHFGVAYTDRNVDYASASDDELINASPGISDVGAGSGTAFKVDDVGAYDGDSTRALEFLWIGGPASVQAEYFVRDLSRPSDAVESDQSTKAYYVTGAYTLTGESRGYKAKSAITDKISPAGAGGAWEVFARYDSIEADCGNLAECNTAGAIGTNPEVTAITVGTNWYANKAVKISLNYTKADSEDIVDTSTGADDEGDALTFRAQLVF